MRPTCLRRWRAASFAIVITAVATACADNDDGANTLPSVTLLATTTTSTTTTVPPSTVAPVTTAAPDTTTASTEATVAPTTAPPTTAVDPAVEALLLTPSGVGAAEFGADPDGVIGYVSSFLGDPTNDTGWIDPLSIGACAGTEIRLVSWGTLTLQFGDASNVVQGRRHLYAYQYGVDGEVGAPPVGLATPEGVTVGSSVFDLGAAYPGVVLNPEDDFVAPNFYVNDNLRGFLTGLNDDAVVTVILGGIGCGE
ncbi:MAG: hypothetical protein HRT86_01790 [Ilumatobacteraceae bacterium]|nr:hypothetical protein [Ilumatobacteraceae bacterium]